MSGNYSSSKKIIFILYIMYISTCLSLISGPFSYKLVNFLSVLCVTASIYSLVAMAFERHRAIAMVRSWQITLSGGVQNYGHLVSLIIKRSCTVAPGDSAHAQTALQTSFLSKRKLATIKMLVIMAILFAVSWLPYFTLLILAVSRYPCFKTLIPL